MKGLVITLDKTNPLLPVYQAKIVDSSEAPSYTREAYMVIALCDSHSLKQDRVSHSRFLECVANSPLKCRKELQVKSLEYVLGTHLSELVSIESFPEPSRIKYLVEELDEENSKADEDNR